MKDQINLLLYMLDDVRKVTLKGVSGLTKEQLFQEPIPGEYPIGSFIMHMGECDLYWLEVASGLKQPEELEKRVYSNCWYDCKIENSNPPKEPIEIEEYFSAIAEARERLRNYLLSLDDSALEEEVLQKWKSGQEMLKRKWIIYHLIEHEAHHRGQMFMLIRMAGFKKKGVNN